MVPNKISEITGCVEEPLLQERKEVLMKVTEKFFAAGISRVNACCYCWVGIVTEYWDAYLCKMYGPGEPDVAESYVYDSMRYFLGVFHLNILYIYTTSKTALRQRA